MKNIIKKIFVCFGIITLILGGCFIGIHIEKNNVKDSPTLETQEEKLSTIAVVNMDEGVVLEQEKINYANMLINYTGDNFVATGMNDAIAGIDNGLYAAYIIIPENFSVAVNSLENNPVKIQVEYKFNTKLDRESELQAVKNVNEFVNELNSNISYIYVDAILEEYHRVQDSSTIILNNDNTELVNLQDIDASLLIAPIQPVEEITVESDIEPVDLSVYTNTNNNTLAELKNSYVQANDKGKEEFKNVMAASTEIQNASLEFFTKYEDIIKNTNIEQEKHLKEGQKELSNAIGLYNQNAGLTEGEVKNKIEQIITAQKETDKIEANKQLDSILEDISTATDASMEQLNTEWEDITTKIKTYSDEQVIVIKNEVIQCNQNDVNNQLNAIVKAAYEQGAKDSLITVEQMLANDKHQSDESTEDTVPEEDDTQDAGEEDAGVTDGEKYSLDEIVNKHNEYIENCLQDDVSEYVSNSSGIVLSDSSETGIINWDNLNIEKPIYTPIDQNEYFNIDISFSEELDEENVKNSTKNIMDLFKLKDDKEKIDGIINNYFEVALLNENKKQMNSLIIPKNNLSNKISIYENKATKFNPYTFIEQANMDTYLYDIEGNTAEMMSAVQSNNSAYMSYASALTSATAQNSTQLRTALTDANTQTVSNVDNCVAGLIESRQNINEQNVLMLESFTGTLQYTRVGSLDNVQVYDYIVNPVLSNGTNEQQTPVVIDTVNDISNDKRVLIILLIGILSCSIGIIAIVSQLRFKRTEED